MVRRQAGVGGGTANGPDACGPAPISVRRSGRGEKDGRLITRLWDKRLMLLLLLLDPFPPL